MIPAYFSLMEFVDRAILSLTAMKNTSSRVDKKYDNIELCKKQQQPIYFCLLVKNVTSQSGLLNIPTNLSKDIEFAPAKPRSLVNSKYGSWYQP